MGKGHTLADLTRIVGSDGASDQPHRMSRYIGDALGAFRAFQAAERLNAAPRVVVWPQGTDQVSSVLRYAQQKHVPVVPYGGGTGVFGAAAPIEDCIILSLDRMNEAIGLSSHDFHRDIPAGRGAL